MIHSSQAWLILSCQLVAQKPITTRCSLCLMLKIIHQMPSNHKQTRLHHNAHTLTCPICLGHQNRCYVLEGLISLLYDNDVPVQDGLKQASVKKRLRCCQAGPCNSAVVVMNGSTESWVEYALQKAEYAVWQTTMFTAHQLQSDSCREVLAAPPGSSPVWPLPSENR